MKFLETYLFYGLIFLPLALVSGPFLSDFLVSSTSIVFLIVLLKKKIFFDVTLSNNIFKLFFVWCLYLIFRSLMSEHVLLSLESSLFYFRFGIFVILISYVCKNQHNFIKYFCISLLITFLVLILDGFFQFIFGFNTIGLTSSSDRISGFFGNEKILGSYLSRLFPLLFGLFIFSFNKVRYSYFFLFILLILSDVLIFITGDRTAFFYLTIFTLIILILSSEYKLLRLFTFTISTILIILILNIFPQVKERTLSKTITEFQIKNNNYSQSKEQGTIEDYIFEKFRFNIFTVSHTKMFLSGINIFYDNVFFGTGPKTYRKVCNDDKYIFYDGCQSHPHNSYIQLLSETGIIGTFPVIFIFCYLIYVFISTFIKRYFLKSTTYPDYTVYLFTALIITLWPIVPTGNFFNNWLSIIYYMPIGFLIFFLQNSSIVKK